MRKIIIALGCVFSVVTQVNGWPHTQTVKGQVVDHQSKSPVIGATIILENSNPPVGAVTDENGIFKLEDIPVGRHDFVLKSVGYRPKVLSNISVGSGKQVFLEIEMIESLTEMEAVEIVAEKKEQELPLNEMATVSIVSLSSKETGNYAATFDDPARAAVSFAGVTGGGDDLLNEIVVRGNSPKGILWRLEGVEIPNPNHFMTIGSSAGGISMLNGQLLSKSDFFTGAFPAQYGNATSGIFDLNLRKGNSDKHEHALEAGLLGLTATSEGPIGKSKKASYLANYRYSTLSFFNKLEFSPIGDQEDIRFQDLLIKVHIPTRNIGSFSIWGLGGANYFSAKPDRSLGEQNYHDIRQKMAVGGITHITYFNENTYLETIASVSALSSENTHDSLRMKMKREEQIGEVSYKFSTYINHKFNAKNTLRVGGIYTRLNFNLFSQEWSRSIRDVITTLDDNGGTNFYQGFAQWQLRVNTDLTMNTGLHLSHFALNHDTYLEPRFGIRWNAFSNGAFFGGAGMHSRRETLSLYMTDQMVDGKSVQLNEDLKFSKAFHVVIGYQHMILPDLSFKSEIYYQHLYDVPVWQDDSTEVEYEGSFSTINTYDGYISFNLANQGTGRNYGIEFTLKKSFTNKYYFMSTASLYQSKYTGIDGVERNTVFNGNHIFNFLGGKEFLLSNKNNILNLNVRFIHAGGKRQAPVLLEESREIGHTLYDYSKNFEYKLDDYVRLDFGISYTKNSEKTASIFAINVQNVLGIENVKSVYFNSFVEKLIKNKQLGMFPNLSYRIEF